MGDRIFEFLNDRKQTWLKDRLKKATSEQETLILEQEATQKFALANWLSDAANRAGWLSMVSHPSKFSHPSAKTSLVIASAPARQDGYWRTGNISYELDVFGNAAAMDVYKFLSLHLSDGQTVLHHLEQSSDLIRHIFPKDTFETLRTAFLKIKTNDSNMYTDRLIKQVYFPIGNNQYHLLSILTPSGIITKLKQKIDHIRFSEESKTARELRRKNEYHEQGFQDISGLTVIGYGGTQPQNISVLNSQNAGRAYLLSSIPPTFEKRRVRLPHHNFFAQSLYFKTYKESFVQLHRLMKTSENNINIRNGIRNIIDYLIQQILFTAFNIRQFNAGWTLQEYYQHLPYAQKIWLDDHYISARQQQTDWQDEIAIDMTHWIISQYQAAISTAYLLDDVDFSVIKSCAKEAVQENKEFF